jgi:hypothetical protein
MQLVAVGIRIFIGPRACVLECNRINYEGVALPVANLVAKERRVRVVIVLAAIEWHEAISGVPVEKSRLL